MTPHVGDLLRREVRVHSHMLHVVTSRYCAVVAMSKIGLREGGRSWTLRLLLKIITFWYISQIKCCVIVLTPPE